MSNTNSYRQTVAKHLKNNMVFWDERDKKWYRVLSVTFRKARKWNVAIVSTWPDNSRPSGCITYQDTKLLKVKEATHER